MAVALREATLADVPLLNAWDRAPQVIAATGSLAEEPADWAWEIGEPPPGWQVLIGACDGRPIGVVRIIDPARDPGAYWGPMGPGLRALDIWIGEADALGRGHGGAMMRLALARCFADPGVGAVLIDPLASNRRAHAFYRRLGFAEVGPRRFGEDDCIVFRLDRRDWQPGGPPPAIEGDDRMSGRIEARLAELGIVLPAASAPLANYVPAVRTGNLLHVSGQVSSGPDGLIRGQLSAADHVEGAPPEGSAMARAVAAARSCGLSLIAQARAAAGGDLDAVTRVVKLTGFVNSTGDFQQAPIVINGCSDLMVAVFGEAGRHARSALGAANLPFGVLVEIEGIFELR